MYPPLCLTMPYTVDKPRPVPFVPLVVKKVRKYALGFVIHAVAGIADGDHHVVARRQRCVNTGVVCIERDVAGLDGELSPEGMASRAFTARFMMTCSICPPSARTGPEIRTGNHHQVDVSPIMPVSILMFSVAMSFRLTILGPASACG